MTPTLLLIAVLTATFGFLIWFALSPSLHLAKTFQIQYDINMPYANRFFRRRILGFVLFFLIPVLLITVWDVLGDFNLRDLGIAFGWNHKVGIWVGTFGPILVIYSWVATRRKPSQIEYPEIRVTRWSWYMLVVSAITWILYIIGLEFLFRGLVLQAFLTYLDTWSAILCAGGMYVMVQYFKRSAISYFSIPYGLAAGFATVDSGSLLPVIMLHSISVLSFEWFGILRHPETKAFV